MSSLARRIQINVLKRKAVPQCPVYDRKGRVAGLRYPLCSRHIAYHSDGRADVVIPAKTGRARKPLTDEQRAAKNAAARTRRAAAQASA